MAKIDVTNLSHSYAPHSQAAANFALRNLCASWHDGGAYALLGPSGCGKSTLLNVVSGLIVQTAGEIRFNGIDVTGLSAERRHIAKVFQFPVLYETMSVYDNLAFPLRNQSVAAREVDKCVRDTASLIGLNAFLDRRSRDLSTDEKQLVSLGRGLVRSDVNAILFDEPLTVIDPQLKWKLRLKLRQLQQQIDVTMIYVTHDQTEALTFADTVMVMNEGCIVQEGTPQELFLKPADTFVGHFIGSPGMNFVPGTVEDNKAYIGQHTIELAGRYEKIASRQDVEIGIRPEFVRFCEAPDGIPAELIRVEDAGRRKIAHVDMMGVPMSLVVAADFPIPFSAHRVTLQQNRIHIYVGGKLLEPLA